MGDGLKAGDYVLATKYSDGYPGDQWAVGFFDGLTAPHYDPPRYNVIDTKGNQFRGNGFRRVKKISAKRGRFILEHKECIKNGVRSLWWWVRIRMSFNDV